MSDLFDYKKEMSALRYTEDQKKQLAQAAASAAQGGQQGKRRPVFRTALIAAAMAVVLAVGAGAAGVLPVPADVFAPIFGGTVAQTEVIDKIGHPIGASDSDGGITISADAIMGDEYNAVIVYTLSRDDGERFLPEGKIPDGTYLMIGGFGGSSWSRGGAHGVSWFVDEDPDDDRVQYVEAMSLSNKSMPHVTATAEFENLTYWDPELGAEATLYDGHWKFRYEVDFEDCGITLGGGETFSQGGLNFTIDGIHISPIAMRAAYTVDQTAVWSDSPSGRMSEEDARLSDRFLTDIEILLTKTDGTVIDLSNSGGSIEPKDGTSLCTKGQVFDEIIPLEEMATISVGGVVYDIPHN